MPEGEWVVINTTPIITLSIIDQLSLLQSLYGTVLIPPAVRAEVLVGGKDRPGATQLAAAAWIETRALEDPRRADCIAVLVDGPPKVLLATTNLDEHLVEVPIVAKATNLALQPPSVRPNLIDHCRIVS